MRAACVLALLLALGLVLVGAPSASADADPASDVLFTESVYLPYQNPVSGDLQKKIKQTIKSATAADYPIKVAVIATPTDLGGIPQLFGKPQQYATFLGEEIKATLLYKDNLLVIMPAGYGFMGPAASKAKGVLAGLKKPGSRDSSTLAQDAIDAVGKLEKAGPRTKPRSGHVPGGGPGGAATTPHAGSGLALDSKSGGGISLVAVLAIGIAALAVAGTAVWWLFLRRRASALRSSE